MYRGPPPDRGAGLVACRVPFGRHTGVMARHDDDRDRPVLPQRAADDDDLGWGERDDDRDEQIARERPPHW